MLRVLPHTFKPALQQIRLRGVFFVVRKTRNLASQLVLQKSHKTSCTFFVARFIVPQDKTKKKTLASGVKLINISNVPMTIVPCFAFSSSAPPPTAFTAEFIPTVYEKQGLFVKCSFENTRQNSLHHACTLYVIRQLAAISELK